MAKPKLTPDQQAVVDHQGGALLVSAAAGSGKTKVLVDRLLRQVCDPVRPCNVDDFLIITFTQAAAAELREKIAREISLRLSEDPGNRHLRRQLNRLYLAQISTVHAFCTELLREHAYLLNLPADFRVGDETECAAMKERVLEELFEGIFDEVAANENLSAFFGGLGYGRDDRRASGLVMEVFLGIQSHAWPEKWLDEATACLSRRDYGHISETIWGKYLLEDIREFLEEQRGVLANLADRLLVAGNVSRYHPVIQSDLVLLDSLCDALSWESLQQASTLSFAGFPAVRNSDDPRLQEEAKRIRSRFKEQFAARLQPFSQPAEEALTELLESNKALLGLLELVRRFMDSYGKKKRHRKVLDFSDLEHDTIRLLTERSSGLPTAAARAIGERFREIMVDEYQDTNEVQDTIFRSISRSGENLFMVGDVKQSIYRFRLADPGIFLEKYRRFVIRNNGESSEPRKILLSANFRSRPAIIEAVNHVFSAVMSEKVGDIAYTEAEQLRTILQYPDLGEPAVELHCISTKTEDGEDTEAKTEAESRFVAARIEELIRGEHYISDGEGRRRIRPEDIAVLMRSMVNTGAIYTRALAARGIPSAAEKNESIFETTEVCTLLALLKIVDNPHRDVPLSNFLLSPVGNFSADDLAVIRCANRGTDLFDALCLKEESDEKVRAFLSLLRDLRNQRKRMELTEFVEYLTGRVGFSTVFSVLEDGERRVRNIRQFCDLCTSAAGMGIRSLSGFVRYADGLREQGLAAQSGAAEGGVTLMTVHKSKGLEFPVVFLSNMSVAFNRDDQKIPVQMDPQLMLGANIVDRSLMAAYPSVSKKAVALKKRREAVSEEMRLLYVAMTRAKDRLIMTYCGKHTAKHVADAAEQTAYPVSPSVAGGVSCMGQWVLLSAALRPEGRGVFPDAAGMTEKPEYPWLICYHEPAQQTVTDAALPKEEVPRENAPIGPCLAEIAESKAKALIPAKLTATQLKGRRLDEESAENAESGIRITRPVVRKRSFEPADKPLTAAQKGTAMHLFMQFCDYGRCGTEQGIAEERQRLLREQFLTPEQEAALMPAKILEFFTSPWGKLVAGNGKVRREFKFSLLVRASEYFPDAEDQSVMLQGVVDCFVIEEDGITVLDYKTDHAKPGDEVTKALDYQPQLRAYSHALERIYGIPVVRRIVYFFATGTACEA